MKYKPSLEFPIWQINLKLNCTNCVCHSRILHFLPLHLDHLSIFWQFLLDYLSMEFSFVFVLFCGLIILIMCLHRRFNLNSIDRCIEFNLFILMQFAYLQSKLIQWIQIQLLFLDKWKFYWMTIKFVENFIILSNLLKKKKKKTNIWINLVTNATHDISLFIFLLMLIIIFFL